MNKISETLKNKTPKRYCFVNVSTLEGIIEKVQRKEFEMILFLLTVSIFASLFAIGLAISILFDVGFARYNRVGGLRHWRFGRIGGSFYVAKARG